LDGVGWWSLSDHRRCSPDPDSLVMRPYRFGPAAVAAIAASLLMPIVAFAEDPGNGGTVSVGPVSTGPVVSKGSAGYDPDGITPTASPKPSGPGTTSTEPTYNYRPVPYNAAPGSCPTTQTNGTISNPCSQIPAPVCPTGQTGYYVYDSITHPLGTVFCP